MIKPEYWNIPKLKAKAGECISYFRKQKDYGGTEKNGNDTPQNTGETLYLGSTSSELYMCAYQKNYEQYVKNGTEIEDTEIKNRFEIRMKNERAYYAVVDLLTYRDAERTSFLSSIIMSALLTERTINRKVNGKRMMIGLDL